MESYKKSSLGTDFFIFGFECASSVDQCSGVGSGPGEIALSASFLGATGHVLTSQVGLLVTLDLKL